MNSVFENDEQRFVVVINHEKQHSIWPEGWEIPIGWTAKGVPGIKAECLAFIEQAWPDIHPYSLASPQQGDAAS